MCQNQKTTIEVKMSAFSFNTGANTGGATPGVTSGFGTPATATPSLFGATATPSTPASSFGGFGSSTPAPTPAQSPFSFSSAATPAPSSTAFGGGFQTASKPAAQTPSWGAPSSFSLSTTQQPAQSFSSFSQQTQFSQQQQQTPQIQQFQQQPFGVQTISEADNFLNDIKNFLSHYTEKLPNGAINQNSDFTNYFYDEIDPSFKQSQSARIEEMRRNKQGFASAERDSPDAENTIPVPVVAFSGLDQRLTQQKSKEKTLKDHVEKLFRLVENLEKATRIVGAKVSQGRNKQMELTHKLLQVLRKIEVLRCLNSPFDISEKEIRDSLREIRSGLQAPQAKLADIHTSHLQNLRGLGAAPLEKLSQSDLQSLHKALELQQEGLQKLTNVLRRDMRDVKIMASKYCN